MALVLLFLPQLIRSIKQLGPEEKRTAESILEALQIYYATNCDLEEPRKTQPGFFYKQLRRPYYEAGIEKHLRVVIRREKSNCYAMFAGNHDQIKRFLSSK